MEPTKPTIFLGLGGTGNLAISFAKRLYEEEYGEGNIPPSVAFVTVDFQTDMDADPGLATNISDNFIRIESATNPREFYRVRRENHGQYTWMFDGNTENIDNRISKGAKAVRTTGRLYTEMVLDSVMNRLNAKVNEVMNIDTAAMNVSNGVNIHMVMSLAGGTGAGSFITIANAIKQKYGNQANLFGYGVTHSVFRAMDIAGNKTPNVELNAYSSILDLDYLQTASESNPLTLEMGTKKVVLREPFFDGFYIIDNTSENGYTLKTVKSLCEVIGTCLYACGAEAGDKVANVINNIGPKEGKHHVGHKRGWVQALGACQVVYKGELMAETYSLKAAVELIRKMRQEGTDIQQQALNWTQEVGIREDGEEYNMLIDSIYSPKQIQGLREPLVDAQNTEAANKETIKKYLVNLVEFPTEEIIKTRTDELKEALDKKVKGYLKNENGIGNSIKFLTSLITLCNKYKREMEEEAHLKNEERDAKTEAFMSQAFAEYKDRKHGRLTWNSSSKNQELIEDIIGRPAKAILKLVHEAKRREVAREMFVALIAHSDNLLTKVNDLDKQLYQLSTKYEERLTTIQSASPDAFVFEYDLSYKERINLQVNNEHIIVSEFTKNLEKSLLDIVKIEELSDMLLSFTINLETARQYKEKLITDVVDELSEEDYQKLKNEIARKSARWLRINDRGQCVNSTGQSVADAIAKNWIVTVYKNSENYKSRLDKDSSFLQNVHEKDFLYVEKDIAKQRMTFCRIDGSLIPYCIDVLSEMATDRYESAVRRSLNGEMVFNPHFDKHLFEKMKSEDFKLKPEMKDEAMFYWVCGHLFGVNIKEDERIMDEEGRETGKETVEHTKYVCCLRKKYMYWDPDSIGGKDDHWQPLGNTGRRDTAFNTFKTSVLPENKEKFKKMITSTYTMNRAFWEEEIKRIQAAKMKAYIDRIVCSDKNSSTYIASNSGEYQLIQKEWDYIEKSLLNAIGNLK